VIAELTILIGGVIKSVNAAPSQWRLPNVRSISEAVYTPRDTSVRTVAIAR